MLFKQMNVYHSIIYSNFLGKISPEKSEELIVNFSNSTRSFSLEKSEYSGAVEVVLSAKSSAGITE